MKKAQDPKRRNPQPFAPVKGHIYENAGGGRYLCESQDNGDYTAWMMNIVSGWTCKAKGLVRYENGMIEWDWSTDGHFEPIGDEKRQEIYGALEMQIYRERMKQRQRSLVGAMLCMI